MASIAEDFRTFALADATILAAVGTRVHQHRVPDEMRAGDQSRSTYPRIWYRKALHVDEPQLDGSDAQHTETTFDVEILTEDPDELDTLTDAVRTRFNGAVGTFGSRSVLGVFVDDHDEDYVPYGDGADDGTLIAALSVLVIDTP